MKEAEAPQGGAPQHPQWYHNLKADPNVEIRDKTEVYVMRVREIVDSVESELSYTWKAGVWLSSRGGIKIRP